MKTDMEKLIGVLCEINASLKGILLTLNERGRSLDRELDNIRQAILELLRLAP